MEPIYFHHGLAKVAVYEIISNAKIEDYRVYTVAWYIGRGNRCRKTYADKREAMQFAQRKVKELSKEMLIEVPANEWKHVQRLKARLSGTPLDTAVDFYLTRCAS